MDVYLIRHTAINVEAGICYGQSDIELSDSFPKESKIVQQKLPVDTEEAVFYSSPLSRCRKLASELAPGEVHLDERLKELDFGDWEGQKWDDIDSKELQEWMDDFVNVACPGGESYRDLVDRITAWWNELTEKDHQTVVVITHSGVIRSLLAYILDIPYSQSFRLTIDWGHLSAISVNEQQCSVKFINR